MKATTNFLPFKTWLQINNLQFRALWSGTINTYFDDYMRNEELWGTLKRIMEVQNEYGI